ncbi:MAG: c-type cytochrome [Chloroflexi bacterium]|nr:c-type cytochrome [Chloroflexota bacterium]
MSTQLKILVGFIFTLLTCVPLAAIAVNDMGRDFNLTASDAQTVMQKREASLQGREIEVGAELYGQYCAGCHGNKGEGIPTLAPAINRMDLLDGRREKEISWSGSIPAFLKNTIAAGRPVPSRPDLYSARMPTWGNQYGGPMRPDQVDALVAFVLNWREDAPEVNAWPPPLATGPRPSPTPGPSPTPAPVIAGVNPKCQNIKPEYVGKKSPYKPDDRAALAAGKTTYDNLCASCHGTRGRGDGPTAASLNPKPANLADKAFMQTISPECHLFMVSEGVAGTGMPPWKSLGEDALWKVIIYERSFSGVP